MVADEFVAKHMDMIEKPFFDQLVDYKDVVMGDECIWEWN